MANNVVHFTVESHGLLSKHLEKNCPGLNVHYLITTGSVYRRSMDIIKGKIAARLTHDTMVSPGDYIRVHTSPRRYQLTDIRWDNHIVYDDEDFIVVNKPCGVPSVPTTDNIHENVVECVAKLIRTSKLFPPHRLDTDTSGLMVLGKTKEFAAFFAKMMARRQIKKKYKVLVAGVNIRAEQLAAGCNIVHFTGAAKEASRVFAPEEFIESRRCELNIISQSEVLTHTIGDWKNVLNINGTRLANRTHFALDSYFSFDGTVEDAQQRKFLSLCELELELLTGRTHQIRGQLQELGSRDPRCRFHVAGDNRYVGPSTNRAPDIYRSSPFLGLQVRLRLDAIV
jgi:23S rRNA-/tRNA-specific pseudouridylate synthase